MREDAGSRSDSITLKHKDSVEKGWILGSAG